FHERALLARVLAKDSMSVSQSIFVQLFVSSIANEQLFRIGVGVVCQTVYEATSMPAAEHRDQADLHARTARVVNVGIGPHQRRPRCGPTGINKTKYRKTRIRTKRFVGCDTVPGCCVWLTVISDDHGNLVSA